ncbi:PLD nuclease N-terminal domain-containing protein [Nocardioides lijunqiniae]|uniref:PLD nuclease N-terminal domain-containing protein n=1 Tax=Nocardioides lijunqiniae TaxID=2760832 RepID=UPI0018778854|nr:PLD nuclease N-terminal domain-containing protein [Nocardioides lijunqiniae]
MAKKTWSDLTASQRRLVVVGGLAEVVLTTVASRDLARRPASEVRGPKTAWALALAVQPVGPLAYLVVGRR